jgi:hypothetical protein
VAELRQRYVRRRAAFWRGAAEAWSRSGLTQKQYCSAQGLSWHTFREQLRVLRNADSALARPRPTAATSAQFLPVRVVPSTPSAVRVNARLVEAASPGSAPLEVAVAGGRRVLVHADFETSVLRKLVLALEGLAC